MKVIRFHTSVSTFHIYRFDVTVNKAEPDLEDAERGVSEHTGLQVPRNLLVGCRGNTPAGGGGLGGVGALPPRRCRILVFVK